MVTIDNIKEVTDLLKDVKELFHNMEHVEKKLITDLSNKEAELCDIRHEIEISDLNAIEIHKIYKLQKKVLLERRDIKNKLELINTMKPYINKFVTKGICAETEIILKNIETLKNNQENKHYTPRIIKDLKCAKKKEKE